MITPPLVQEAFALNERISQEEFVFAVCQQGAEAEIKARYLNSPEGLRLAFSRPGLLTFKLSSDVQTAPRNWLIRQSGFAFGTLKNVRAEQMVEQALELAGCSWEWVHVFQRDPFQAGTRGFEPGPTELTQAVGQLFGKAITAARGNSPQINIPCPRGERVLDIVLIEPDQWLIGHHIASATQECWVGGAFSPSPPAEMISRAYLKMAEAVAWSELRIQPGDAIVEIGSAPGGSSQRLLDMGLKVTGVDPAEMDPLLLEHARFTHWRNKSSAIRRRMFAKFRWLAADANVAPNYTLDAVEDIVTYPTSGFQGLLLTFKLSSYELAEQMPEYLDRIRSWNFDRVDVRQLASNRSECCVVAERAATWKRPSRVATMQKTARANAAKRRRQKKDMEPFVEGQAAEDSQN